MQTLQTAPRFSRCIGQRTQQHVRRTFAQVQRAGAAADAAAATEVYEALLEKPIGVSPQRLPLYM